MDQAHDVIKSKEYQGEEPFTCGGSTTDFKVADFWRWMGSNLLDNTMRGILAEYIVASALGITAQRRQPWLEYDLLYNGLKIEVKSAAYLQYWFQQKPSRIAFSIAPHKAWDPETNTLKGPAKRHADIYVFCLLETKEVERLDPMDLDQWGFYMVPRKVIDERYPRQKSLSMASLMKLGVGRVSYPGLKEALNTAVA